MQDLLRKQLEGILGRGSRIDLPVQSALYEHLDENNEVVLFGAGNLGRQVADVLLEAGVNLVCFSDNQQALWESKIKGIPVLAPKEAVSRYQASAYFVVAIWHPCSTSDVLHATEQLRGLGAVNVAPFSLLLERFPALLPRMFWGTADNVASHVREIEELFGCLADDVSRKALLSSLRLRLFHDFDAANQVSAGRQYFPPDVYSLRDDEVFVDCGAFDGDSMADFLAESGGKFRKIIAFEANPHNFEKLRSRVRDFSYSGSIETIPRAVGAQDGTVRFSGQGVAAASVCETGDIEVPCVKLDTALLTENPTIIKMDIEGAESEALAGARTIIKRTGPLLAVCIYHKPADIWELPFQMRQLLPESRIFLRQHCADGFDLVCYAVPEHRSGLSRPTVSLSR